jgi:hypothetical protein
MHSLCLFWGVLLILYCFWQWFRCFFTAFTSLFHQHGFCSFLFFISLSGTSSSCVLAIMSENDWYISSIVWSSVGLFSIHSPNLCSVLFFHSFQSTLLSCQTFFGVPHVWDIFVGHFCYGRTYGYITKKGTLDSQSHVIKFTSCLPMHMVGGSLNGYSRLPPPLNLVATI